MKSRNQFGALIAAGLLGLAAVAIAPRLHGGGGDEGGDILPAVGPSELDGPAFAGVSPSRRFLFVHGASAALDTNDLPISSGILVGGRSGSDVVLALPDPGTASLDLLTKGRRRLAFSELAAGSGAGALPAVHLNGRFELEDIDPQDGETLEAVSQGRTVALGILLLGHRSTLEGGIRASFSSIELLMVQRLPQGAVDLSALRAASKTYLSGTGLDVAVVLLVPALRGFDEVWVAWNVDDQRALFDVEVKLR
jgi:hypothetical protein